MSRPAGVFVHEAGICESQSVGPGTRIGAFTHVLSGATIGRDCEIGDHVFIEGDVVIGDRAVVRPGVHLCDGVRLASDVVVGPNATFASGQPGEPAPVTQVGEGASIGANATIHAGVTIGRNALIGVGAVVARNVPPNAVVEGNPARISAYRDTARAGVTTRIGVDAANGVDRILVGGARMVRFRRADDLRGSLTALEFGSDLPFVPARMFCVFGASSAEARGEHAHRTCHQLLTCVSGSMMVLVDDGTRRDEVILNDPGLGLYLPPMTWGTQYGASSDATLVVLASHPYDPDDYIRDYEEYRMARQAADSAGGPPA